MGRTEARQTAVAAVAATDGEGRRGLGHDWALGITLDGMQKMESPNETQRT